MYFKWIAVKAMIPTHISSYLWIESFNFKMVFCTVFALKIPFISPFYIVFNIIIHCTRTKIHEFMKPKSFLSLRNVLLIYRHIKCIYSDCMIHIRYLRHQVDNLFSTLLQSFVNVSGVAIFLVSSKTFFIHCQFFT
jgi:hypothetical protein